MEHLVAARAGRVCTLTIDRPEVRHALSRSMVEALQRHVQAAMADPSVGALVLASTGPEVFVAGGDIREFARLDPWELQEFAAAGQALADALMRGPKPCVAALAGHVIGGGLELALACDLRVLAQQARVQLPEVALGVVPAWGGLARLVRTVGTGRAAEMLFLGRALSAEEALAWGLVTEVWPREQVLPRAQAIAAQLAEQDPEVLALLKEALHAAWEAPHAAARRAALLFALGGTRAGFEAGVSRFLRRSASQDAEPPSINRE